MTDVEEMYRRRPKRQTNWKRRPDALSADDVLLVKELEESIESLQLSAQIQSDDLCVLMVGLYKAGNLTESAQRAYAALNSSFVRTVMTLEELEKAVCSILYTTADHRPPVVFGPPKNRTIDSLREDFAYEKTRYTKVQLHVPALASTGGLHLHDSPSQVFGTR